MCISHYCSLVEYHIHNLKLGSRRLIAWFIKITFIWLSGKSVCECLCVPAPRLLVTGGMMWHDMNSVWLVKNCHIRAVVSIISRRCTNQAIKIKLSLYMDRYGSQFLVHSQDLCLLVHPIHLYKRDNWVNTEWMLHNT